MKQSGSSARPQATSAATGGFVLVALGAALWGSDALFRRGLALELPAATVVFYEHAILVALTLPLLARAVPTVRDFNIREWIYLLVIGAGASATATVLFTAAFRYGDPTTPLLLQKLQPLIAVAGAGLLLGERLRPRYAGYFLVAVIGAYLVHLEDPLSPSVSAAVPALLAVGAAALWGLGTVLGRALTDKTDFMSLTALRFAVGLPAAALVVAVDQGATGFAAVDGADFLPLALLALVPGLAALLVYYRGLSETPASLATIGELAFPVSAITVNYIAFGETLTATQWLGVIVLTATITTMSYLSRRPDSRRLVGVRPVRRPATLGASPSSR